MSITKLSFVVFGFGFYHGTLGSCEFDNISSGTVCLAAIKGFKDFILGQSQNH